MANDFRKALLRKILKFMFRKEMTVPELRKRSGKMVKLVGKIPSHVKVDALQIDELYAEWIIPPDADEQHVILHFHGGGYVSGSVAIHKLFCIELANATGTRILLPVYRLAPENPFPAALDDALGAYQWLLEQSFEAKNIIVSGDSAGGGLALATALALRDAGVDTPAAIFCISPWTDLKLTGNSYRAKVESDPILNMEDLRSWALCYAGEGNLCNPLVSPAYADFHGFPPMLIQVGSEEILLDDAATVAEKAKAAGIDVTLKIWPGMWHVWHATGIWLPEAREALAEIGQFVRKYL